MASPGDALVRDGVPGDALRYPILPKDRAAGHRDPCRVMNRKGLQMRAKVDPAAGNASQVKEIIGAVSPHILLTVLIIGSYLQTEGSERRTSAGWALVEVFLFPAGVLIALFRFASRRTRGRALGILVGTVVGALLVVCVALAVDHP